MVTENELDDPETAKEYEEWLDTQWDKMCYWQDSTLKEYREQRLQEYLKDKERK